MADQKINELPTKTAPSTGDKMLMIGAAEEYQIDYDKLASAILNKLSTQSFSSLDTTSKTVLGAIDELNSKTITHSTYPIYEKQTMMIEENGDSFYQLVVFRGSVGNGYNAVLLTGYGIGTDSRYHYKLLDDGSAISISISDTSFVIKNEVQTGLVARIFNLYGNSPTVSVS